MNLLATIIAAGLVCTFMAQLVTRDEITSPIRDWLANAEWAKTKDSNSIKHRPVIGFVNRVVSCYRCSGVWLSVPSAALVLGAWPWDDWRIFAVVAIGASATQFALMRTLDKEHTHTHIINNGATDGQETDPA